MDSKLPGHYCIYKSMNVVSTRIGSRLGVYSFCQQKMISPATIEAPIKHRVMSTNQWPAPYYQRLYRSYPVRKQFKTSLLAAYVLDDVTWWVSKEGLKETLSGRKVLEQAENSLKSNSSGRLTQPSWCTRRTRATCCRATSATSRSSWTWHRRRTSASWPPPISSDPETLTHISEVTQPSTDSAHLLGCDPVGDGALSDRSLDGQLAGTEPVHQ